MQNQRLKKKVNIWIVSFVGTALPDLTTSSKSAACRKRVPVAKVTVRGRFLNEVKLGEIESNSIRYYTRTMHSSVRRIIIINPNVDSEFTRRRS